MFLFVTVFYRVRRCVRCSNVATCVGNTTCGAQRAADERGLPDLDCLLLPEFTSL